MEALAVIEVLGRRGEVVARERIHSLPATIGRGFDCDLILEDDFVAPQHLQITADDSGGFYVSDLGSLNGFSVVGLSTGSYGKAARISAGQPVRLGHTQIRIWRPDSPVAPELPALKTAAGIWVRFIVGLSIAVGLAGLVTWVGETGAGRDGMVTYAALMTAIAIFGWSGLWWISSRHGNRGSTFIAHAAIAGEMVCLVILGEVSCNSLAFAFDLYAAPWSDMSDLALWAVVSFSVFRHLRLVSRKRKAVLGALACLCVAALILPLRYASSEQDREKLGELEVPTSLRPPWMRMVGGVAPDEFFK